MTRCACGKEGVILEHEVWKCRDCASEQWKRVYDAMKQGFKDQEDLLAELKSKVAENERAVEEDMSELDPFTRFYMDGFRQGPFNPTYRRKGYTATHWKPWACRLLNRIDFRYWSCECHYEPPFGLVISADCGKHD